MNRRRTEIEIAIAILSAAREEEENGPLKKTRLQARAYLSWNAFNRHIERLAQRDLLSREDLKPTDRGRRFLQRYHAELRSVLESYGF